MLTRRRFLQATALAAASTTATGCGPDEEAKAVPPGVPLSSFGKESTSEEVTQGLDLTGRNVLITGVNSGLGQETMRVLAMRGAHVLGTARSMDKAREACAAVQGKTTPLSLDLADFPTVAACADSVRALGIPLDAVICNAGIMALPQLEQVNGIERHFVVNHLGHFVLVSRLLDQVSAAAQGRVVVVSSGGYRWAPEAGIEFDNLSGERGYEPNRAYGQSKLANGLFSLELARRLEGTNATSNSVHPGVIHTNLGRHFPKWKQTLAHLIGWTFMKSVEQGAATSCYVATAPTLARVSGQYFEDCNPVIPGGHMRDGALAARLWDVSTELTRPYLS